MRTPGIVMGTALLAAELLAQPSPGSPDAGAPQTGPPPNVLVIVADDLGVDCLAAYAEHPAPAVTPHLDALAAQGLLFRNAWATPGCSPTRAMLLTGRQASRTLVGSAAAYNDPSGFELDPSQETLPKVLAPRYESAVIGKWHLGNTFTSGPDHPLLAGFATHRGSLDNIPQGESYFAYTKAVDGQLLPSTTYATTDTVDDALEVIASLAEPWYVVVNFNAPHAPYHAPPDDLHDYALPPFSVQAVPEYARAMGEAMDREIGRLLEDLPGDGLDDTLLFFLGDNGTMPGATLPPWPPSHAKGTPYEGGVNVPFIAAGYGVTPGVCNHLVSAADIFATVAELAQVHYQGAEDSVSFAGALSDPEGPPARQWVFTESFRPNGPGPYNFRHRTIRNKRYKLISFEEIGAPDTVQFFDLRTDPFEAFDLLRSPPLAPSAQIAFDALSAKLEEVTTL